MRQKRSSRLGLRLRLAASASTLGPLLVVLALALVVAACDSPIPRVVTPRPTLSQQYPHLSIPLGAAVSLDPLLHDAQYRETIRQHFSLIVPETAMDFEAIEPQPGAFDFGESDAIVRFGVSNGLEVAGHALIANTRIPDWLTQGHYSPDEVRAIVQRHITTVVRHYRGQLRYIVVANEAFGETGLVHNFWYSTLGPNYLQLAFTWAHEADPSLTLLYNDFYIEGLTEKSDAVYAFMKQMRAEGVPVMGLGLQTHVGIGSAPPEADVVHNMKRFAALGMTLALTEMDVKIQTGQGDTTQRFAAQADIYRAIVGACRSVPACTSVTTWGVTDRYSWIPGYTGHPDAPLLFDERYQAKPAYQAVLNVLAP